MDKQKEKWKKRTRRHHRVRRTVQGTLERPRLSVYRSLSHIYAQIIDDVEGKTLVASSTRDKEVQAQAAYGGNCGAAKQVGEDLAAKALDAGIQKVVFDRGGQKYHGRIKALADAAREKGLKF